MIQSSLKYQTTNLRSFASYLRMYWKILRSRSISDLSSGSRFELTSAVEKTGEILQLETFSTVDAALSHMQNNITESSGTFAVWQKDNVVIVFDYDKNSAESHL